MSNHIFNFIRFIVWASDNNSHIIKTSKAWDVKPWSSCLKHGVRWQIEYSLYHGEPYNTV